MNSSAFLSSLFILAIATFLSLAFLLLSFPLIKTKTKQKTPYSYYFGSYNISAAHTPCRGQICEQCQLEKRKHFKLARLRVSLLLTAARAAVGSSGTS